MKKLLLLIIMLTIYGCNKPKTVLICGDHVCINKTEAEQYFEDNLILEVRVIDNKAKKEIDLIELNLKSNSEGKKEISMLSKDNTRKPIKILSNDEIERKKEELKNRNKNKNTKPKKQKIIKKKKVKKDKNKQVSKQIVTKKNKIVKIPDNKITDICTILEKCSIDEISEFLVKQGKEKKFPDITIRENK
ncbi:hypothetical protein IDG78_03340 [Pelagibacterales bacterium SAG-MED05]|nr:hypothetical protein [Pelagibacterales bacterium SAG-MED05]